jgi:voltage-gated potassium channel
MRPLRDILTLVRAITWAAEQPEVRGLLSLTAALIAVASAFYAWVEGWGLLDAFYFSVVTIATVGYGDIVPTTAPGKLFTIVYIFAGIGLFATTAGALASQALQRSGRP